MKRTPLLLGALFLATGCSSLSRPDERSVYKEPPAALVQPAADIAAPGEGVPAGLQPLGAPQRPPSTGG